MSAPIVLAIGAGVAKLFSIGWLASIATAPVALESRKRFIEVNKEGLQNLVRLGKGPNEVRLAELEANFKLLEDNINKGWDEPHVFAAAMSISHWKFWENVFGAGNGVARLTANTATLAAESISVSFNEAMKAVDEALNELDKGIEKFFSPIPVDKNDSDNRHSQ